MVNGVSCLKSKLVFYAQPTMMVISGRLSGKRDFYYFGLVLVLSNGCVVSQLFWKNSDSCQNKWFYVGYVNSMQNTNNLFKVFLCQNVECVCVHTHVCWLCECLWCDVLCVVWWRCVCECGCGGASSRVCTVKAFWWQSHFCHAHAKVYTHVTETRREKAIILIDQKLN